MQRAAKYGGISLANQRIKGSDPIFRLAAGDFVAE
jgi:hypothetical protein